MKNFLLGIGTVLATIVLWPFRVLYYIPIKIQQVYKGSSRNVTVTIPLMYNQNNFYGEMTIGTSEPEQVVRVQFDTGSPNLWVVGVESCLGGGHRDCTGLPIKPFNGSKSSSYKKLKKRIQQGFAGQAVLMGSVSQDHVKLGIGDNSVLVKNQLFGEANIVNGIFENHEAIFGLDLVSRQMLPQKPKPPVWELAKQFKNPVFGFHFISFNTDSNAGKLVIGGGDEDCYEGELNSHQVVKNGRYYNGWFIKMDSISIVEGGIPMKSIGLEEMLAHPDSGSNVLGGPMRTINQLNSMILNSGDLEFNQDASFPCDKGDQLPDVVLVMGGKEYTLQPADYVGRMRTPELNMCRIAFIGLHIPYFLLGQIFMNKYYTRFDIGKKRIQIAKAKQVKPLQILSGYTKL